MKTIFRQLLLCAIACLGSGSRADDDKAFNNNFAEAESRHYYRERDRWPTNLADLASFSKARYKNSNLFPRFSPEDYRTVGFTNLANGDLQLTLTSHSGKSQVRVCKRPPTTATAVIQQEGYLIVQDGSSFYYFDKENTFFSGPLDGWCGRAIRGNYRTIAPWSFTAEGTMTYFNRPCTPTRYRMKMEVNSVERDSEPFDFRILIPFVGYQQKGQQPFPTNPVVHKAYFVFDSLIPVEEQEKAP
ncbi:MAG: hypothetical protein PHS50_08340 [Kiritimatiellae bacterium]|jgi:hypothetical protein|nr:hypothetical protein [Kiritimatiellia bacterium]